MFKAHATELTLLNMMPTVEICLFVIKIKTYFL